MNPIRDLWEDFRGAPFPQGLAGKEIDGVDLVEADSFAAGCISTFIGSHGNLPRDQIDILRKCLTDIDRVIPSLDGEARRYFSVLRELGRSVLEGAENAS
jgi:hypothetical protein